MATLGARSVVGLAGVPPMGTPAETLAHTHTSLSLTHTPHTHTPLLVISPEPLLNQSLLNLS